VNEPAGPAGDRRGGAPAGGPPRGEGSPVDQRLVHLRAGGVSLLVDARGDRLPRIAYWGPDLGPLPAPALAELVLAARPPVVTAMADAPTDLAILPEGAAGWPGEPGLLGHRDGRDWSPQFAVTSVRTGTDPTGDQLLTVEADDPGAGLALGLELVMSPVGVLRLRARLRNQGEGPYQLHQLRLALPLPPQAQELLDLAGRHLRERAPQRHELTVGTHVRESRRGRPGLDASLLLVAGERGFGFGAGQVWAVHLAWSGNHRLAAERLPDGRRVLGGGELLLPGEVRLDPGEQHVTPWLFAVHGDGLDELSHRLHAQLRARPHHPSGPRPVILNTWEAVYFEHDLPRLLALADAAAQVGVERYVLDDGWFRGRVDDTAGLGDWSVDRTRWPDGLGPLVRHVRALGMQFGLWVEPEMVNPDSDLYRAHPDWVLQVGGRLPVPWRHQQVLDLTRPEAFEHVLTRLDALVREYAIDYLKWDHNRDLVEPGHQGTGVAVARAQTLAVYRLMDELRARHPGLEIESCASGGGRADLGILERTDRVWASDCNDALERQSIQRWTGLLLPPELVGSHLGAARAHSTARVQDLPFRAGTALFGHLGIEWDLSRATGAEREQVADWVRLYKRLRPLLHSGRVVRVDHPDPALWVHGVIAQDGVAAVFALVAVATAVTAPPGPVRLPGLDPTATYRVRPLAPADLPAGVNLALPAWLERGGCELPGRVLGSAGLAAPDLFPEQLLLLELTRLD
jgi:alpha-galactosidase